MPRAKNDGLGRNGGGRQKGTPNKDKPIKAFLRAHSTDYFEPRLTAEDFKQDKKLCRSLQQAYGDRLFSRYDVDVLSLKPSDRVKAELDLLKFHTPQMQSVSADVDMKNNDNTFANRLGKISRGEQVTPPDE